MDNLQLKDILTKGIGEFGISLSEESIDKLLKYKDILKEWNKKINLTAIEDDKEIMVKHFIDSLSICPNIENKNLSIIDIGTGAGFPGIPIKVVYDKVRITLLDSLEKRIKFLNEIINILSLKNIEAIHGRAEDFGKDKKYRDKFDIAVARAVANLPVLLEYCLPFVKTNGLFIAMKGSNIEEVNESKKALSILGGEIVEQKEIILPSSDIKRNIIIIRKFRQTPPKYPRISGKPSKNPLK